MVYWLIMFMNDTENIKEKISKNAIVTAIALTFFGLTTFIYNVLIGRIYGAEVLGLANTAISSVFFIGIFVAFFASPSGKIVAEFFGREDNESANYLMGFSFLFTILTGLISIIILWIIRNYFIATFNLTNTIFLWILILIPLRGLFDVFRQMYYGTFRVGLYLKVLIISSIVFFIVLMFFYFMLLPLLLPFILMYLVFSLISIYIFKGNFNLKASRKIKRGVQKYAFSYAFIAIIGNLADMGKSNFSVMLSAMFLSATQVGYFSAANSLMRVLNYIPAILPYALFPVISYEFGKKNIDRIKRALNRIMRVWAVTLGFIVGLSLIYSQIFLYLFFGAEYLTAVLPLIILLIGFYFQSIIIPLISTLSGTKYIHISSLTGLLGFMVSTIAFIFLIPSYGIVGTALGIAIGNLIMSIVPFYFSRKFFDFKFRNFFYPFVKFVVPLTLILFLFTNDQRLLYTIGAASFTIFYLLANREEVIYLYEEAKNQLKVKMRG